MAEPHLRAENLHVWRGDHHVLHGVGFDLESGQVLQITGPNGAGKTSLLRTLCGLVHPEEGRVLWNERDARDEPASFHASLAYVGHDVPLKADLTVMENLAYWVGVRRADARAGIERALETTVVSSLRDRMVRTLSAGQKRRVALAGVLALAVPLWLLDEPTTNLDADGQSLVARLIGDHTAHGGLVVAAVHHSLGVGPARVQQLTLAV